ncbi:MAG: hypothetical protein ACPGRE_00310 [Flavobacteriaceae bacterium]
MAKYKYRYRLELQFLGFRYSGWQHHPDQNTVQGRLDKTLRFVFKHENFTTFGQGRTDAKVSAEQFYVLLLTKLPVSELFFDEMNSNLPNDMALLDFQAMEENYDLMGDVAKKTYSYRFSFGKTKEVFKAATVQYFKWDLDLEVISKGVDLLNKTEDFTCFTVKENRGKDNRRSVLISHIIEESPGIYRLDFTASGFLRYQIRLMMGALILLSRNEMVEDDFIRLTQGGPGLVKYIAGGSGLCLTKVALKSLL